MTLKLVDGTTSYNISLNIANAAGSWTMTVTSQLSNLPILDAIALTIEETNDRYTEFSFSIPADMPLEHRNGIYDVTVTDGVTIETFLLKLVAGSGGGDGYTAYESNNENNEGPVYYRPQY